VKDFGARGKLVAVLFSLITMLGCGALDAGTPAAQSNTGLVATSAIVDFGSVPVGTTQVRANTITNDTKSPVVLTGAQIDRSDFKITGQKLPLTLAPGAHVTLQIAYSPQNGGTFQSRIVLASNVNLLFSAFTLRGTATLGGRLRLTPSSISFGNVQIGKTQTQSATLSNFGFRPVTVTRAAIAGKGFTLTGLTLPRTLKNGESATFDVSFTPAAGGITSGTISVFGTVALNAPRRPVTFGGRDGQLTTVALNTVSTNLSVPVSGTGMGAGQLAVSPTSLALGKVKIGASQTQSATLINSGSADLTIRQATVTGRGFRISGLGFPMSLGAGQRKNFTVTFTPQAAGNANGSIVVITDASATAVNVPVSAVATTSGVLISNPSSLSFGSVQRDQGKTLSAALTNSGGSSVTVSQANVSGAGFTLNGLSLPVTLAPGQSASFGVTFKTQSTSGVSGGLSFVSDAANATLTIPLVANAAAVGVLSTSDSSLNFGGVQVNATGTQPETLTNSGGANVTITQAKVSGTGFSITGLTLPLTLNPGQSFTFGAAFSPPSGGNFTGSISVVSDASDSNLTITLAGTATVSGQLAVSPATLNFGTVTVGQSKSLTASLTANGSSITLASANMSTSEFTISGLALPLTLTAGQSASFTVSFKPQASGTASASGSFNSNASNSSLTQVLSGTAVAAPQHSVALSWNPSSSTVVGYNIYRGTASGGPYSKINAMNADTTYTDSSVQSGQTYFYVTTAVDGSGNESANSNQAQVVIPTP
jgi:ASPM-SPD-2-Hydin domain-containing protein/HYDIN/CFA65/VesB family protein/centrosomal CEP192-like protein